MAFKGITFAGQNVTPKNDGGLYNAHYDDGILWGCGMALSGDDLVISSGEFIMCGRVVQVDGATNVDLSGRTYQTGYIQVIMNADLTQGEGSQWYTTFVESTTTTFPTLTPNANINATDTLYQVPLAVVQISGGALTSLVSVMRYSPLITRSDAGDYGRISADSSGVGYSGYDSNGNQIGGMSVFDGGDVALWADGDTISLRPNGVISSTGQTTVDTAGTVNTNGNIRVNRLATDSEGSLRFYVGGTHKGMIDYDIANTKLDIWNPTSSTGISFQDGGNTYATADGNFYIRPNAGSGTNQTYWRKSDGQQVGGHPYIINAHGSPSATLSNGSVYNLTNKTGLDSSGTYLVTGLCAVTANGSNLRINVATGASSGQQGIIQTTYSNLAAGCYAPYSMLLSGQTAIYFNVSVSNGTGTLSEYYFRIVRVH